MIKLHKWVQPLMIASIVMGLSACKTTETAYKDPALAQLTPAGKYASYSVAQREPYQEARRQRPPGDSSLWNKGEKSLFGDRRASQRGDILTVVIEIDDEAELKNTESSAKSSSRNLGLGGLFGLPEKLDGVLPSGASSSNAIDVNSSKNATGNRNMKRNEKITLRLAAQVMDVLPNGYLVLSGQQQIMVNSQERNLQMSGLVRTEDISRLNVITYDKIANARIYYGGKVPANPGSIQTKSTQFLAKVTPF